MWPFNAAIERLTPTPQEDMIEYQRNQIRDLLTDKYYWMAEYQKRTREVRAMHRTINRLHRRLVRGRHENLAGIRQQGLSTRRDGQGHDASPVSAG